jgi:hypothetical protein
MGMILEFYAVPPGAYTDPAQALVVAAQSTQVASISINSRAIGDVLAALVPTFLAPLVGDADVVARAAHVPAADFGQFILQATVLRVQPPSDDVLLGVSEAIDEAVAEARWRTSDLLVVSH